MPTFNYASFIAKFPAFKLAAEATIQMAWDMGANWINQQCQARWGLRAPAQWQAAADLMGAVIMAQLYGPTGPSSISGPINNVSEGSVSVGITIPAVGSSAFRTMLLSSPPYGPLLLSLLQVAAGVSPYIASGRPGSSSVPP